MKMSTIIWNCAAMLLAYMLLCTGGWAVMRYFHPPRRHPSMGDVLLHAATGKSQRDIRKMSEEEKDEAMRQYWDREQMEWTAELNAELNAAVGGDEQKLFKMSYAEKVEAVQQYHNRQREAREASR